MKKADISINIIIIAAIGLIVLVILIAIFTGRMGSWGQGVSDAQKGITCTGQLEVKAGTDCGDKRPYVGIVKQCGKKADGGDETPESDGCLKPGYVCCVR